MYQRPVIWQLLFVCCFLGVVSTHGHAASVILNEYNAVGGNDLLDDGDGQDSFFGSIEGNGGNWFELLVVDDHVDMRGWSLQWTEDEEVDGGGTAAGTLLLSDDNVWSDLRSGSLITFIETADAGGAEGISTATDVSFDPAGDDWWLNVATREEASKNEMALVTTTTNDGTAGDFSVGNSDWTLTIVDGAGSTIFGPVGEGAGWQGDGVNDEEGGSLEGPSGSDGQATSVADWQAITPLSDLYDDTSSTSFGALNVDYDEATMTFTTIQDASALRAQVLMPPTGDGDFNGDGQLTAADIDALTLAVRTGSDDLTFDLNGDDTLTNEDRLVWVEQLKQTYLGDSNLDGEFNSNDLVTVLTAGEYEDTVPENSTWATGDWNGDGDFTSSDFVAALAGGGYEVGPRAATAAVVPEPASAPLALFGVAAFLGRCWHRRS